MLGDSFEVLKTLPADSVDSGVTDPPYGIRFMGKAWDGKDIVEQAAKRSTHRQPPNKDGSKRSCPRKTEAESAGTYDLSPSANRQFQEWTRAWAAEVFRVLKPGAYLVCFASTRTYHRMACGIEDAGFEIRDQLAWTFAGGFPKSLNLDNVQSPRFCRCVRRSPVLEYDMPNLRDSDLPKGVAHQESSEGDLFESLPKHGLPNAGRTELSTSEIRKSESGMEGRSDIEAQEGKLPASAVCEMPAAISDDGQKGRLCDGTPLGDGLVGRPAASQSGMRPSCRSSSVEQPTEGKSGTLAGQQEPQDGGAWPLCRGCRKPIIPRGLGTALKPAWEPICLARKPIIGTVAGNLAAHGTGCLNIVGCRIPLAADDALQEGMKGDFERLDTAEMGWGFKRVDRAPGLGRWPANLCHDGSDEVVAHFPSEAGAQAPVPKGSGEKTNGIYSDFGANGDDGASFRGDSGSAARFFFSAKTSRTERDAGLEEFATKQQDESRKAGAAGGDNPRNRGSKQRANHHPTVKPVALMRWLVRLVTPIGGTAIDPFMGSGTTGVACICEDCGFIGIERESEYMEIARARIDHARGPLFVRSDQKAASHPESPFPTSGDNAGKPQ